MTELIIGKVIRLVFGSWSVRRKYVMLFCRLDEGTKDAKLREDLILPHLNKRASSSTQIYERKFARQFTEKKRKNCCYLNHMHRSHNTSTFLSPLHSCTDLLCWFIRCEFQAEFPSSEVTIGRKNCRHPASLFIAHFHHSSQ